MPNADGSLTLAERIMSGNQIKDVAAEAAAFEAKKRLDAARAAAQPPAGSVEQKVVEKPEGGTQVVEAHSGFHTSEDSERLLGKRKGPPQLTRGVFYDADGHAVSLGGTARGESGIVRTK